MPGETSAKTPPLENPAISVRCCSSDGQKYRPMTPKAPFSISCILLCIGCAAPVEPPAVAPSAAPSFDDRCFARTPPRQATRIVTEQVMVLPERTSPDGSITSPPVFREQSRPVTETVGEGVEFETLCPAELTEERIATLQRALKARLAYDGPVTGVYDGPTQEAVQAFQKPSGFDSPDIARVTAEQLGVIAARRIPE